MCPAVECDQAVIGADEGAFCPISGTGKFSRAVEVTEDDPLVRAYIRLLAAEGLDLAGIEFVTDANGDRYTYDINGTTNYSGVLAQETGIDGMREVARWLRQEVVPCLLYTSPSPRDKRQSRMPSSA